MIQNPVLIIGCPRSGTTLLYNLLSEAPDLWSIGYESKEIIEKFHHPRFKKWESGSLDSDDVTEVSKNYILSEFRNQAASGGFWKIVNRIRSNLRGTRLTSYIKARGRSSSPVSAFTSTLPQRGLNIVRSFIRFRNTLFPFLLPKNIKLLEKTPENCLRLPFLYEIFPDARIIYIVRDGRANIYSLMEGWKQPHIFPGYKIPDIVRIPGDTRGRWAFTLIPGWRDLLDRPLEEVCAWQWYRSNQSVLNYIDQQSETFPNLLIRYEDLVTQTRQVMEKIAEYLDFPMQEIFPYTELPAINVVSKPDTAKWRKKQDEIMSVAPIIKPMMEKLGYPINSDV